MTAVVTPTLEMVFAALGAFIESLITCPVVRGNQNRVPMPDEPFICMTEQNQRRLSTNIASYNDPGGNNGVRDVMQPTQFDIGIDCYGPLASDWAKILVTMFNDGYAVEKMGGQVVPLYADDAMNMPLVNGEQEYEQRWRFTACMQYNPVVTVAQQFADELMLELVSVDAEFPPSP